MTDTHLQRDNIALIKSIFNQVDELALKLKVGISHAGDMFESRNAQPQSVLNTFEEILDELKSELDIIPGNHDKTDYTSEKSYLDLAKHYPNLTLIKTNLVKVYENIAIHYIPYFTEDGVYHKYLDIALSQLHKDKKNVLITHVGINEFKNNDGELITNQIRKELFYKFDLVLIGHYHDFSITKNLIYFGSTNQNNFSEDSRKGCCILYDDLSIEYVKLKFKEYIDIIFDLEVTTNEQIYDKAKEYGKIDAFVRFNIRGNKEKLDNLNVEYIRSLGIEIKKIRDSVEDFVEKARNNITISMDRVSIKSSFCEFMETKKDLIEIDKNNGINYLETYLK